MKRILIVDDYPLTRTGVCLILQGRKGYKVVGEAGTAKEALKLLGSVDAHLAVIEVAVPGMSGLEFIRVLRARKPAIKILVLSRFDEMKYAAAAVRAGAGGYVEKRAPIETFLKGVQRVSDGEVFVSENVNRQLLQNLADHNASPFVPSEVLSSREKEIFQMMGRGLSAKQIAEKLQVSRKTIDTHRLRMKKKLHLKSITEMTCLAVWWVDREAV